ncbi:transporter [Capnocytophaga felis]|uniref:Transporter n=1 Tax=Capnocytophaga felis TaxID=2267611 RepID=A0A5M4B9B7_9FLAO|nr:transporter [Capnocytophaga felis]GET46209.1 hypothetical protein RCZ01_15110 [Capnocytophaga felis]GET48252.1 hypothetical protein RCZ02_10830 [Capnocytophaga felis]
MQKIYLLFLLLLTSTLYSQQIDNINTDRPDQSEGVYTLPKNKFQLEDGFTFSNENISNNLMLRYGIFNGTEVRLSSDFEKSKSENIEADNLVLSFKQRILEEKDYLPAITLVGYLTYKNPIKGWQTDVYLAFENNISDEFVLCYNVGTSNFFRELNVTTQFGYSITKDVYTFLEYFAIFGNQLPLHNFDTGLLYSITSDFQVDMAFGRSIFNENSNWFVSIGFAYRFF